MTFKEYVQVVAASILVIFTLASGFTILVHIKDIVGNIADDIRERRRKKRK